MLIRGDGILDLRAYEIRHIHRYIKARARDSFAKAFQNKHGRRRRISTEGVHDKHGRRPTISTETTFALTPPNPPWYTSPCPCAPSKATQCPSNTLCTPAHPS
eukprot:331954-Chlamydomonas_euryale.AAC.1